MGTIAARFALRQVHARFVRTARSIPLINAAAQFFHGSPIHSLECQRCRLSLEDAAVQLLALELTLHQHHISHTCDEVFDAALPRHLRELESPLFFMLIEMRHGPYWLTSAYSVATVLRDVNSVATLFRESFMGRKPLSDGRKSDRPLRIRLTDAERNYVDLAAKNAGKQTSTWARDVLIAAAKKLN